MRDRAFSRRAVFVLMALVPIFATAAWSSTTTPRAAARTVWDSVYTMAQASRGETAYAKSCARCHGASLGGGDESPALTGGNFLGNWNGLPVSDLQTRVKTTMPSDSVGIYPPQLVIDVIAYLFKANGFPAGQMELPKEVDPLKEIVIKTSRPDPGPR
jgi:mono/diheme cytochrome c family protein